MRVKEVFLTFVAFVLLFILFCVVTLTGIDSDKYANQPTGQLNNSSGANGANRNFIHSSTYKSDKTARTPETQRTSQIASNQLSHNPPSNRRPGALSSSDRVRNADIKHLLKPVESNGRVYLENTSGIEACVNNNNNNNNEQDIETIE